MFHPNARDEAPNDKNCRERQCRTPRQPSVSNASVSIAWHSEDGLQGPARLGRDWFRLVERRTAKGKAVFEDSTVDEGEVGAADSKVARALLARTIGKFEG